MKHTFLIVFIVLFVSCKTDKRRSANVRIVNKVAANIERHSIAILPFIGVDRALTKTIKDKLEKEFSAEIVIINTASLPDFAFYKPRQRYIADSLLVFLKAANNKKFEKIIGVTTRDIATRKGEIDNWGFLGLGSCPGEACVISAFRAGKNSISNNDFLRRMTTLALYELGHTYGLEHCRVVKCLMKDAEGKMNLVNGMPAVKNACITCRITAFLNNPDGFQHLYTTC
jgi:archaemetzincin